jgi:flagellar biosynthesis/type III secretory pathway chaperone
MEGYSNRIEHMKKESQSSKIKQKLKEKEILVKQLKSCERNSATQSKTSNLRIMGTEEEEVQAKGIHNIFNKIRTYNFSNLKKVLPIQVQASSRTPNRLD